MPSSNERGPRVALRAAGVHDVERLVAMVCDYHATEGIEADAADYPRILQPLLEGGHAGRAFFIEADGDVAGYVALCFGYSIEFRGRDAFIDEIFVQPGLRGRGIGGHALDLVVAEAERLGARALHLEVDLDNDRARALYRSRGFALRARYQLMTRQVSPPGVTDDR